MNKIKVSIIIPIFNPGKLLINCLNSVLNQTLSEIEILCIDDGSTDDSLNILKEYANKDNRVKIFSQKNAGAGSARNLGIQHAQGEYIIFLDSDDWIEYDMCECLYNHAKTLNVDLVLFNTIRHLKDNKTRDLIHFDNFKEDYKTFTFDYHYIKDKVLNGYFGVIWCKFYKTSFIKENEIYFTKHKMFNDVEYHIKTMLLANTIAYYPRILYHYMMIGQPSLQSSFTGTKDSMCFYDVMIGVKEFLITHNFMTEFKIEFLNYTFFYFKTKLNQMNELYKEEYFLKIKSFLTSLTIKYNDFEKIANFHIPFYFHVINSENYNEFKLKHTNFDGNKIRIQNKLGQNDNNQEINEEFESIYKSNKVYIEILENNLIKKTDTINNIYDEVTKTSNELKNIKKSFEEVKLNTYTLKSENLNLKTEMNFIKQEQNRLIEENNELKNELNKIKSSKLWKLQNKLKF